LDRCAPEDLAKERGAVLEEWRMGKDSGGRAQEAHWKLILQGSKVRIPASAKSVCDGPIAFFLAAKPKMRIYYQSGWEVHV
jgi:hypothetical protein